MNLEERMLLDENEITLIGQFMSRPVFSHVSSNTRIFKTVMNVVRTSGTVDELIIMMPANIIESVYLDGLAKVVGQIRTYDAPESNVCKESQTRTLLYIYAISITSCSQELAQNTCKLVGTLCKPPTLRKLNNGKIITEIVVAVNRRYNKSDYVPAICWGSVAKSMSYCQVGDRVELIGRLQSRPYINHLQEHKVTYEVCGNYVNLV